ITDYIQEQKMQYATMLLNLSDIPIQDVAMQVGINDTSYFTKVYKKFTGLTPGEYRKRLYI
ncbi:helix-turn-helix transcriptional regulator, partial [Parabacteroides distasonis]